MDYSKWIKRFDVRNNTLPLLASESAIDIHNYITGRSREGKAVRFLSNLLNETTQGENPRIFLSDNCIVLSYAISGRENFNAYWEGKRTDELALQTNLVSKDLREFKSLSRENQELLRDFCIRLSQEVSSHYNEYYSNRKRVFSI